MRAIQEDVSTLKKKETLLLKNKVADADPISIFFQTQYNVDVYIQAWIMHANFFFLSFPTGLTPFPLEYGNRLWKEKKKVRKEKEAKVLI